ncbi:MAG: fibronectin type III domain-containing protein, partial [Candidatus Moranbacteria bacterium]|nr:fibronectin type III domain-containing protein [Candidatus Moranbacteria bacterium]
PTLDDVSIGYSYYPTDQNIVSSWYDAVDSTNFLNKIIWDEDEILPSGTGIKFQVQTAPDSGSGTPGTGTGFVGPDGTSGTYFSNSDSNCSKDGQTVTCDIPDDISTGDGSDDQWIAYRTYLTSEGQSSPQLDEVILQYVVNGSPIADDVTVVQNSSGSLEINYYVFDGDNFTQTISFGLDIGITLADNPLDSGSTSINIDGNYANLPSGAQTIQIDQEQIHCDSRSGSVLSSCTRGYNNTRATSHNQGETVWFVNTDGNVSGDAGAGISNEPDRATAVQKSATWDIKSDLNGVFNASPVLRVMANDGQLANQMSLEGASDGNGIYSAVYSDVSFELDTKNPSAPLVSFNRSEDSGQIMIGVTEDSTSGIEYALAFPNAAVDGSSDPCDFSAPDWQSFTYPSQNITVSDNNDEIRKVCVIFKDMYGNTSSNIGNYAITPKNPSSAAFKYYDVSNVDIGDYRLFLSWEVPPDTAEGKESGSNGFSSYEVQRCSDDVANPDCTPDTIYETIVSKLENSLTDNESGTGLDPDMRYCYRYRVKDSNPDPFGDYSKWSDTLCVVPGSGTSSITKNVSIHWYPTAEENVPSDKVYTTQATVRWQTVNAADPNEAILSDSTVWWRVQGSSEWTESYSISSYVEDHSVTIPGRLSPGTTYEYRVTSTTPWGTSDTTNGTSPATFTTKLGPVIRNVQTSSVGNTNAAVEWDTEDQNGDPVNATSVLYYSVALDSNGNLVAPQTGNCSGGYSSHHVCTMTDLVSGYHYYYYVYSVLETDPDGFAADTNGGEYYRFTTTTDTTPPLITPDAGNPLILTDTQAALSFETNERAESWLLYGTTSNSGASFPSNNFDPDNVSHNPYDSYISSASPSNLSHTFVFSLDSLDPETAYYYRFVSEDVSGNASAGDEESFTTLPVQVDQHDPLSSISTPASADDDDSADITRGETFAFVSWTTDQPANQSLSCSETQGGPYTLTTSDLTSYNMSHTLKIISLSPDRQYFCQVVSEDDLVPANSLASSEFSFTTLPDAEFQHDPLSEISDVEISSLSDDSATIVFDTDQSALCVIESGAESGNYTNEDAKEHGYDEKEKFNRHHNIKIENLSASTKYYYQISCEDNLETEITSSEYDFTTNASPDVSGPEILDPMVTDLTYKTATIEWTTDESGNSLVDYGTTTEYGESYGESIRMSTSHSVTLPNLKPLTKYYFQVKSFDANGNQEAKFTDDDGALLSFTTLSGSLDSDEDGLGDQLGDISDEIDNLIKNYEFTEAEIKEALAKIYKITSDGPSANVSGTTVAISWKTSRSSDGKVVYWQDGKSEDSASSSTQIGEESTDHEVIIKNLNAQTTYSYYVSSSTSLGSEITSGTNTFTTGDTPGIFGISVKDITLDSATVTWATDSVESSRVEYGTSINYSQEKTSDESAGQEHSAFLTGLQTGQEYHFRIKGTDSNDEEIVSGDHMFIVLSKPEISDIEVRDVSTEKAVISWKTNTGTDSLVEYKIKGEEEGSSQGKMEAVTDHEIILESLVPGTDYEFKVVSKDQFSNISESEMSSFTTVEDNSAPRINSVKSEATVFPNKDSKIQTIISWVTDKPSNSIIAYKEGRIDKDDGINEKIRDEEADEFNGWKIMRKEESLSNHMFVFTEFKPSSIYYFKVGNVDKRGNISISDNYSILTPAKNKSVLDLIISNFEDTFGWLKQIGGKN